MDKHDERFDPDDLPPPLAPGDELLAADAVLTQHVVAYHRQEAPERCREALAGLPYELRAALDHEALRASLLAWHLEDEDGTRLVERYRRTFRKRMPPPVAEHVRRQCEAVFSVLRITRVRRGRVHVKDLLTGQRWRWREPFFSRAMRGRLICGRMIPLFDEHLLTAAHVVSAAGPKAHLMEEGVRRFLGLPLKGRIPPEALGGKRGFDLVATWDELARAAARAAGDEDEEAAPPREASAEVAEQAQPSSSASEGGRQRGR